NQSDYYLFEIAPSGQKHYTFWRYDERWTTQWTLIADGTAPSFVAGLGKKNTVTVEARGNTFSFVVNGKQIAHPVSDSTKSPLTSGLIGLYVEDQGAEVAFSRLDVETSVK